MGGDVSASSRSNSSVVRVSCFPASERTLRESGLMPMPCTTYSPVS